MRRAEHTHRTAIPSASGRPRERQPAATSPRAGAQAATPTAACRACRTSNARQVRAQRDVCGLGSVLTSLEPSSASALGPSLSSPHWLPSDDCTSLKPCTGASPCDVQHVSHHSLCIAVHRDSHRHLQHLGILAQEKCLRKALPRLPARSCRYTLATLRQCATTLFHLCCPHR